MEVLTAKAKSCNFYSFYPGLGGSARKAPRFQVGGAKFIDSSLLWKKFLEVQSISSNQVVSFIEKKKYSIVQSALSEQEATFEAIKRVSTFSLIKKKKQTRD